MHTTWRSQIVCGAIYLPIFATLLAVAVKEGAFFTVRLPRAIAAFAISGWVAVHAIRSKKLTTAGAAMALLIGCVVIVVNLLYAASLFSFFFVASRITRIGASVKQRFDADYVPSGRRNWIQVISNGGVLALVAMAEVIMLGPGSEHPVHLFTPELPTPELLLRSWLHLAALGSIACAAADSSASELGPVLATTSPVLITEPWRYVPLGTNGGVTFVGFILNCLGGAFVGLVHYITLLFTAPFPLRSLWLSQLALIPIGAGAGLFGSVLDSILGALLQFSGIDKETGKVTQNPGPTVRRVCGRPILDNHLVNLVSCVITAVITPWVILRA